MYGNEIKQMRKTFNITQTELAKATGLPQNTISWIESDKGIPNISQCAKRADFYGITIDELIGRDYERTTKINNQIRDNHGNITFNQR